MEHTVCNLCGANRPRRLYLKFGQQFARCRRCGHVYAGPLRLTPDETLRRYGDAYFQHEYLPAFAGPNGEIDLTVFDRHYVRSLWILQQYRRLGTFLEAGCGAGFFLKAAERDGWAVTGLEIMEAGAEFARSRLGLNVVSAAIEEADFPEASFDVVAMFEVIEHLHDPSRVLSRVRNWLRPGGCLALSTPNVSSLCRRVLGSGWAVVNPIEHLHLFSEHTLRAMLAKSGYVGTWFDRRYAGLGRLTTVRPGHAFRPDSPRVRAFSWLVDRLSPESVTRIQKLGLADNLHSFARRPQE